MACLAMVEGKSTHPLPLTGSWWSRISYIASVSELLCFTPILVSEDFEGSSVATVCPPWERHCFKDGSYDHYQSTIVVAPWPTAIAPKFLRPLVRPGSSLLASLRFPPAHVPTPEGWKAELALTDLTPTDLTPNHSTEVPNLPPACMACMFVPPSWLVATPGWSQFF